MRASTHAFFALNKRGKRGRPNGMPDRTAGLSSKSCAFSVVWWGTRIPFCSLDSAKLVAGDSAEVVAGRSLCSVGTTAVLYDYGRVKELFGWSTRAL